MEKRDRHARAKLMQRWSVHVAEQLAEYEMGVADQSFESNVENAKSDLLRGLDDRIRELESKTKGAPSRGASRALRSQVKEASGASSSQLPGEFQPRCGCDCRFTLGRRPHNVPSGARD
jgi:hypothetical protein